MNEYCFKISSTRTIWICAIDEEDAESRVYEELGYDPGEMELVEINFDI